MSELAMGIVLLRAQSYFARLARSNGAHVGLQLDPVLVVSTAQLDTRKQDCRR